MTEQNLNTAEAGSPGDKDYAIELLGINKTFKVAKKDLHAVIDVSIRIKKSEIFGIIGFSGAGKSTLVRCINLLERPTSGTVIVNGVNLTELGEDKLREERKKIGMIFQNFNLMPSRTAYENVALPLKLSTLSEAEKKQKVLSLLNLVGLADRADSYPSQLSGGQKQRVAIARALANDPKVLLCDEATSALDPHTTQQILALLQKINQKLGLTIVVITHQMSVIKDICDRVAVMENGRVMEQGTVLDVFASPKTAIAKGFIETAENLTTFYEKLRKGSLPGIDKEMPVWFLTFTNHSSGDAIVSQLTQKFGLLTNIVYGNIDFLKDKTLGKLAFGLTGNLSNLKAAKDFLAENRIKLEVLQ
ncbi:MAG: ATP-binding cassette domain-containing protein [Klebsiella quasipneumoniae]|nr:ATP-binding cassette domain-containing protein [Klebsiella quasipneumoniae]